MRPDVGLGESVLITLQVLRPQRSGMGWNRLRDLGVLSGS